MTTREPSPLPLSGGMLLARYRKERGKFTQEEFASRTGSSRSMIAQLESGERQPSGAFLATVCQALQLSSQEEAILFVTYGKLPPGPGKTLACIAALLSLDPDIRPEHKEACIAEITLGYHRYQSEK